MKKVLVLLALLLLLTGCGEENTNNTGHTLPKAKKNMELVCVGDFSEDLDGTGEMYQKVEMVFDDKGVEYISGTVYVEVGLYEEKTPEYMESFKSYLEEEICESDSTTYDTCEIEIDENVALITATGDKETVTGFKGDEDIDRVKKAFEEGSYSCLIR